MRSGCPPKPWRRRTCFGEVSPKTQKGPRLAGRGAPPPFAGSHGCLAFVADLFPAFVACEILRRSRLSEIDTRRGVSHPSHIWVTCNSLLATHMSTCVEWESDVGDWSDEWQFAGNRYVEPMMQRKIVTADDRGFSGGFAQVYNNLRQVGVRVSDKEHGAEYAT